LKLRANPLLYGVEVIVEQIIKLVTGKPMGDKNDSERKIAPLKQAHDAMRIDTTEISVEEVVDKILRKIAEKRQ
jgi:cytidylate kinase